MKPDQKTVSLSDQTTLQIIRKAMHHAIEAHPPKTMAADDLVQSQADAMEAFWTFLEHTFEPPDPKTSFALGFRFAYAQLSDIRKRHFGSEDGTPFVLGQCGAMPINKQMVPEPGAWVSRFEFPFQLDHFWWPEGDPHPKVNITAIECDGVSAVAIEGPFEFALLIDHPMLLLPACRELTVRYEVIP